MPIRRHALFFMLTLVAAYAAASRSRITSETMHAHGTFDVKLTPQSDDIDPTLGRMTIEKQIHGDLEATSKGQMLTVGTAVQGSGVYVAVERVTGKLNGRSGSFAMHHTGVMERGTANLKITIVPDSGTGELTGIYGTFNITITDGKHLYDLTYSHSQ